MTATIGLARLPHVAVALFDEASANLLGIANDLDALVGHGPEAALSAIADREAEGDRITHDLVDVARATLRAGPDRADIVELAQAIDDVVDSVDELAWLWSRRPVARVGELLLCVRDVVRAAAGVARKVEDDVDLTDLGQAARASRTESRRVRAWLLVEQHDARLAVAGHGVVAQAERCVRVCLQLGARIDCYGAV
jgi:uncharacterized protein Yka (UPF0111/DUF47 family)